MWIYEALRGVETLERTSSTADVTGVQYDSRQIRPGDVFVAMRGETTDGNRYITEAMREGARVVVTDSREVWEQDRRKHVAVPFYLVANGRRALAGLAANLLDHPERKLAVSAVTGTNGKTTTAFILEQMLRSVGRRCVLVGTIETHVGEEVRASEHTTPESRDLLSLFADGVDAGATEAVMEMSSHALEQERVWGVHVDVGVFTNLTQDHLDYHGTMERYFQAKLRMFRGIGAAPPRVAVVNADDVEGGARLLREELEFEVLTYGIEAGEYRAEKIQLGVGETRFEWKTPAGVMEMDSPLTGRVNVYNLLAAACAGLARGLSMEEIATGVRAMRQVPGRFQVVGGGRGEVTVVVDYAHTDDALRKLTVLARELVRPGGGRVITVFGCGGDRDRTKRPRMGRAAGDGSDVVVLTSDNPRTEEPEAILAEALVGVRQTSARCVIEVDRRRAISVAIEEAAAGDIVLIAGKGHEKMQILRNETVPFDDVAIAEKILMEKF